MLMCVSPHAASAQDAASHNGFDERANVFVFLCSFALCEAAPVTAKLYLVLQTKWLLVVSFNLVLNVYISKKKMFCQV